jgi:predicted peroxiredoxin
MDMKNIMSNGIEMYESLLDAINEAGGNPSFYCWAALKDMSVQDLIANLATNGIRFMHCQITQELANKETNHS